MPNADYEVLSAMLSPALFMTATGSLLLSANNRLARVVDRFRKLTEEGEELLHGAESHRPTARLAHVRDMIVLQQRRASVILAAIVALYAAFASFVGTSLSIALNYLAGHLVPVVPTALGVLGVCLLLFACTCLLREARLGIRALHLDADFYKAMQADAAPLGIAAPGGNQPKKT